MPLEILLADDHQVVRQGLRALLEREGFTVVAEAADGREAVQLAIQHQPGVAILDLTMPLLNGLDAAKEIARVCPSCRTVLLTVHSGESYILGALQSGVRGYVLKTQAASDLVTALREVVSGGTYLSPRISGTVVEAYRTRSELPADPLTPRQRQVLQLVAEGKTTKEIAAVLGVSTKTAESHRNRLMRKLGIHETANLVRYAIRCGLIEA
jgi:two-component system, NarL family, response regulator NreC